MINREKIIEKAFLTLGMITKYNDNTNRFRATMETLLDNIIDEISHNKNFAFNMVEEQLTYNKSTDKINGEYKYNRPIGMMNIVYPTGLRVEGEFIYSDNAKQRIRYNKSLNLNEYPNNIINYLRFKLCYEMSLSYTEFRQRVDYFYQAMVDEEAKITNNEAPQRRNVLEETMSVI